MVSESDCLLSLVKLSDKDLTPQLPQLMCSLRAAHLDEQQTQWSHANSLSFPEQFLGKGILEFSSVSCGGQEQYSPLL